MKIRISPRDARLLGKRRLAKVLEAARYDDWPTDDEVVRAILEIPMHFADLTIVTTSVIKGTGAIVSTKQVLGETCLPGQAVYAKATDSNRLWKGQCDTTDAEAAIVGLLLDGGAIGQNAEYQSGGEITIGATLTVGVDYFLSATAGGICLRSDLVSTNRIVRIGRGKTATIMTMDLANYGLAVP